MYFIMMNAYGNTYFLENQLIQEESSYKDFAVLKEIKKLQKM